MPNLIIRTATQDDLTGILAIYNQPDLDNGKALELEQACQLLKRFQSYPNYRLFIALLAEKIVGTYALLIMDNLAHGGVPSAIVEDVGVLPDYQGQGIGRQMMQHARELAKEAGCYKLVLSSNDKREKAHKFYQALGFKRHGISFLIEP